MKMLKLTKDVQWWEIVKFDKNGSVYYSELWI